ncbi:MAG: hypothetical protein JSR63_08945 [Proteobacteria bacterium]|nr:hypothetical protein [Pseudomonadota bacterium]MBS0218297.1 hypothetical protein [Pseudomonadota bacterium]
MFGPDDLAAALRSRRRALRSIRPQGESPFLTSWREWLHALPAKAASPAYPESDLRDLLAKRGLPKRKPASRMQLTRWQSFRSLFRNSWDNEDDGNRRLRIGSAIASLIINLFFAAMLLWLMYLRFMARPTQEEELAMQVQLIGQGAPEEEGGGTPQPQPEITVARASPRDAKVTPTSTQESAAPQSAAVSTSQVQTQAEAVSTMQMQAPQTPAKPVTPQPLPPSTPILVAKPTEAIPKFTQPPQQMPQLPTQVTPQPELQAQALPNIPEPEPVEQASLQGVRAQAVAVPTMAAKSIGKINLPPTPAAAPNASAAVASSAQSTSTAGANAPLRGTAATTGAPSATVGNGSGVQASGRGVGAGTQAKTGGPPTPLKGDDWGAASRNVAGQPHGAINGNRNGGANGDQYDTSGTAKYGADQFTVRIKDPYKEGSWVKRQARKDDPTMFEPYWVPHENLLEEWVRRGIKEIEIPLDGSGKRVIKCKISLLALGGGCGIAGGVNGVKDNPARARKPPAVPFKSKYFDDPSALGAPEKGAEIEQPKP